MIYHVTPKTDDAVTNLLRIVNRKLTYNARALRPEAPPEQLELLEQTDGPR